MPDTVARLFPAVVGPMGKTRIGECPFCGGFDSGAEYIGCTRCRVAGAKWRADGNHLLITTQGEYLAERGATIRALRPILRERVLSGGW